MAITLLPTPPSRQNPSTFSDDADTFLSALPNFGTEANQLAADVNDALDTAELALSVTEWADLYLGSKDVNPLVDNQGDPLLAGSLYFNNPNSVMRVYNGTVWQDASSSVNGTANRYDYTVETPDQTVFLAEYDVGFVDVYLNGVRLVGEDFTATNGTSITLTEGVPVGSSVYIIGFGNFSLDMTVPTLTGQEGKFLSAHGDALYWDNPLPCYQIADASAATGTYTFDYAQGDMQQLTATGNISIAFTNFPVGKVTTFIIDAVDWGTHVVSFDSGILFAKGKVPVFSSGGTDRLVVVKDKDEVFSLFMVGTGIATVA